MPRAQPSLAKGRTRDELRGSPGMKQKTCILRAHNPFAPRENWAILPHGVGVPAPEASFFAAPAVVLVILRRIEGSTKGRDVPSITIFFLVQRDDGRAHCGALLRMLLK